MVLPHQNKFLITTVACFISFLIDISKNLSLLNSLLAEIFSNLPFLLDQLSLKLFNGYVGTSHYLIKINFYIFRNFFKKFFLFSLLFYFF